MKHPRISIPIFVFMGILMSSSLHAADDKPLQNPALKRFYNELETLFRRHYPKVTSHLLKDSIHFEHDTRIYIVHVASMTGEWQDPWETRGPKRGGILCDVTLHKGEYEGQAAVPQTFDDRYFKMFLAAPYSKKRDQRVEARLSYPSDVKKEFLEAFTKLVNDFETYLD